MTLLPILYWIILVLSCIGIFTPPSWPYGVRIASGAWVILFIIIGLKIFRMPL